MQGELWTVVPPSCSDSNHYTVSTGTKIFSSSRSPFAIGMVDLYRSAIKKSRFELQFQTKPMKLKLSPSRISEPLLFCALLANLSISAAQAPNSGATSAPGDRISSFTALTALQLAESPEPLRSLKSLPQTNAEGMVVYRVVVKVNGRVAHYDRITAVPELQPGAEVEIKRWHFTTIQHSGKDVPWWSFLGVCYSHDWAKFQPCAPPEADVSDYTAKSLPRRIYPAPLLIDGFRQDEIPGTPLHRVKGDDFHYPRTQLGYSVHGEVEVKMLVAADGSVRETALLGVSPQFFDPVTDHPFNAKSGNDISDFVNATIRTARQWAFKPITFCGNPVEVQLRLAVRYTSGDSPVPSP